MKRTSNSLCALAMLSVVLTGTTVATANEHAATQAKASSPGETQSLQGRIMTLHEYLTHGAQASEAAVSEGTTLPGLTQDDAGGVRTSDRQLPGQDTAAPTTDLDKNVESRDPAASASPLGTSVSGASPSQPMVLVVSSSTAPSTPAANIPQGSALPGSTLVPGRFDGNTRTPTEGDAARNIGTPGDGNPASSPHADGVYVLVFDPTSPASRFALGKARHLIPQDRQSSRSPALPARPDRIQVRALEDPSDPNRAQARDDTSSLRAEGQVTVTGRVLRRGGIQAIEVTSVEKHGG